MYPTIEQVQNADRYQICSWYRFLKSPGESGAGQTMDKFDKILKQESKVMDLICKRFKDVDGMTPQISKSLGW